MKSTPTPITARLNYYYYCKYFAYKECILTDVILILIKTPYLITLMLVVLLI